MNDELKEYLYREWRYNVLPKYLKYFDEWYSNLTEWQRIFFTAYMQGKKTPY